MICGLLAIGLAALGQTNQPEGVLAKYTYKGHSYLLLPAATWSKSEAEAVRLGGHLVTINDAAENAFILEKFLNASMPQPGGLWIGLSRNNKGKWVWADGKTKVRFTGWGKFQPDNTNDNEPYAEIVGVGMPLAGKWNDFPDDPATSLKQICYGVVEIVPRH